MDTQTIFKTGNSSVVSIPKHILKGLGLKTGQKVTVEQTDDGVIIRKAKKGAKSMVKNTKSTITPEFKEWLDSFIKEYRPILQKLAHM